MTGTSLFSLDFTFSNYTIREMVQIILKSAEGNKHGEHLLSLLSKAYKTLILAKSINLSAIDEEMEDFINAVVVTDMHGDEMALNFSANILQAIKDGTDQKTTYICLGDYLGKGPKQLEHLILHLIGICFFGPTAEKVHYRNRVYITQGNEERDGLIEMDGGMVQWEDRFGWKYLHHAKTLITLITELLPIWLTTPGGMILTHAGPPLRCNSLDDFRQPVDPRACLWSTFNADIQGWQLDQSEDRGAAFTQMYGPDVVKKALEVSAKCEFMVVGHKKYLGIKKEGFQIWPEHKIAAFMSGEPKKVAVPRYLEIGCGDEKVSPEMFKAI